MSYCESCCCGLLLVAVILIYKWLDHFIRSFRLSSSSRYVFITGCDSGFGQLAAKRLDSAGCHVFAGCLTEQGEEELRTTCSSRLHTISLNVANHDSVVKAYEKVKSLLPAGRGLWGVLNNAGIAGNKIGPAEWLTLKDYNDMFAVNILGVVDVSITFLPLIKRERGRIVNTASVFGRHSLPGNAPYCMSKYGVEAFSDSIRRELRAFGVSVHLIEPGFHRTNMTRSEGFAKAVQAAWDQTSNETKREYGEAFMKNVRDVLSSDIATRLCSERISDVVDAYEHALLGRYPRARYVVGWDARLFWLPVQWMPEWLADWLLHAVSNAPLPAACY